MFRLVWAVPAFRVVFATDAVSTLGDQVARVAVALLVWNQTGSAWKTAGVYVLFFLPDFVGSITLAWTADYYPRRSVLVVASAVQAVAFAAMAIPGTPLWMIAVLLTVSTTALAPARAAQVALVADVLQGGHELRAGQALMDQARQVGQVVGLAVGGALVVWVGTSAVLAVNAVTFAVTAVAVGRYVPALPAAGGSPKPIAQWQDTIGVLRADAKLLALIALAWMAMIVVVPDGIVAPLVAEIAAGDSAVGLLLAVHPLALLVTLYVVIAHVPQHRLDLALWVLATLAVVPLVGFLLRPGLIGALLLLAVSGVGTTYLTLVRADVTSRIPARVRGSANALIRTGLRVGQGLGVAAGGVLVELTGSSSLTIAVAGLAGCAWVTATWTGWRRATAAAP